MLVKSGRGPAGFAAVLAADARLAVIVCAGLAARCFALMPYPHMYSTHVND
jgi:hypothetical protein